VVKTEIAGNQNARPHPGPTAVESSKLRWTRSAEFIPLPPDSPSPQGRGLKSALLNSTAVGAGAGAHPGPRGKRSEHRTPIRLRIIRPASQGGTEQDLDAPFAFAGFLSIELAVAMAILAATLIPMSYAFLHERQLSRACYYRAVAMEIVDGEIELLQAGEWRAFAEGSHSYSTRAESARNLPPGRFVLTREGKRLRLEWLPEKRKKGGRVSREVTLP